MCQLCSQDHANDKSGKQRGTLLPILKSPNINFEISKQIPEHIILTVFGKKGGNVLRERDEDLHSCALYV